MMRGNIKDKLIDNNIVIVFLSVAIVGFFISDMNATFVVNEVITRFVRNGIMVLALIIPIISGLGLNFAISIGALCANFGFVIVIMKGIGGYPGLLVALLIGVVLSVFTGYLIGVILNKVKGNEMIATIIIGFLGTSIYQLVFMVGYGTVFKVDNKEILLSKGIGIRHVIDMVDYRNTINELLTLSIGGIRIPIFMIALTIAFALVVKYILNTPLGIKFKAVGEDFEKSKLSGINSEKVRIKAIIISTVMACVGQIIYLQDIGMLSVYTAHMNRDVFACAAILVGGATLRKASIKNAFVGLILFHFLFVVTPQAGQNLFSSVAIGEYFRTFIAYGIIAFSIMYNSGDKKHFNSINMK
ncbi:MAG: ABC transporter permease [Clostridium sp.]